MPVGMAFDAACDDSGLRRGFRGYRMLFL